MLEWWKIFGQLYEYHASVAHSEWKEEGNGVQITHQGHMKIKEID